ADAELGGEIVGPAAGLLKVVHLHLLGVGIPVGRQGDARRAGAGGTAADHQLRAGGVLVGAGELLVVGDLPGQLADIALVIFRVGIGEVAGVEAIDILCVGDDLVDFRRRDRGGRVGEAQPVGTGCNAAVGLGALQFV